MIIKTAPIIPTTRFQLAPEPDTCDELVVGTVGGTRGDDVEVTAVCCGAEVVIETPLAGIVDAGNVEAAVAVRLGVGERVISGVVVWTGFVAAAGEVVIAAEGNVLMVGEGIVVIVGPGELSPVGEVAVAGVFVCAGVSVFNGGVEVNVVEGAAGLVDGELVLGTGKLVVVTGVTGLF
jgi:hypothetical protein